MKYAFIQRHKRVWPISVQCRVLRVSVSGYHEHLARRVEIARRRYLRDEALLVHISAVYAEDRGADGWPRIWRQLRAQGIRAGKQRVQRLMQKHGIQARGKRRFRVTTTDSQHDLPMRRTCWIASSLLPRPIRRGLATSRIVRPASVSRMKGGALLEHVWNAEHDDWIVSAFSLL